MDSSYPKTLKYLKISGFLVKIKKISSAAPSSVRFSKLKVLKMDSSYQKTPDYPLQQKEFQQKNAVQ